MPRLIDVVDHTNVGTEEFAWREPQEGSGDFRMGSQVIVGESQAAVFVRGTPHGSPCLRVRTHESGAVQRGRLVAASHTPSARAAT